MRCNPFFFCGYHFQRSCSLCSHTSPISFLHSFPTIKCFSRWLWVQQQHQQSMVGALLECTHTHHGQHLFMNGPTIAHPPTATADRGRGTPQVTQGERKDKGEEQCSQSSRRGTKRKERTTKLSLQICFMVSFVPSSRDGPKTKRI